MIMWEGVVEDRNDPLFLGRCRVRVFGWHSEDKLLMPTDALPWALPLLPPDDGKKVTGYKEGDWVAGYFRDGSAAQLPIIVGKIPGIPEAPGDPTKGFSDPTPPEILVPGSVPRPPEMVPPPPPLPGDDGVNDVKIEAAIGVDTALRVKGAPNGVADISKGGQSGQAFAGGPTHPGVLKLAGVIQHELGGQLKHFTAFNDGYHKGTSSKHAKGLAFDFTTSDNGASSAQAANKLRAIIKMSGAQALVIDEYKNPSSRATAGHVHCQFQSPAEAEKFSTWCDQNKGTKTVEAYDPPELKYNNPDRLPVTNTSTGQLKKEFGKEPYPFDVNGDGKYDLKDALALFDPNKFLQFIKGVVGYFFYGEKHGMDEPIVPITRYPLEHQLKEPVSSRLARNQKTEDSLVQKKKEGVCFIPRAAHKAMGVGTDEGIEGEDIGEPETPYNAKYPYNHVYESESGHVREIDDTPMAERLHDYHRSGTFHEVHPNGLVVDKSVSHKYDIADGDHHIFAGQSATLTATEDARVMGKDLIMEALGVFTQDSGGNRNIFVGGDANTRIKKDVYTIIEGDVKILIKGSLVVNVENDIKIKSKNDINIKTLGDLLADGTNIRTKAQRQNVVQAGVSVVTKGIFTSLGGITSGNMIMAHTSLVASSWGKAIVMPAIPDLLFNKNDQEDIKDNGVAPVVKEGYVLNSDSAVKGAGGAGDLWKPVSDSDGKAVFLSTNIGQPATIYEAVPTGELKDAILQYKHKDATLISWDIKRPGHKLGRQLEVGRYSGNGNGGREHWRFSLPGSKYPDPIIVACGDVAYLIVEPGVRHENFGAGGASGVGGGTTTSGKIELPSIGSIIKPPAFSESLPSEDKAAAFKIFKLDDSKNAYFASLLGEEEDYTLKGIIENITDDFAVSSKVISQVTHAVISTVTDNGDLVIKRAISKGENLIFDAQDIVFKSLDIGAKLKAAASAIDSDHHVWVSALKVIEEAGEKTYQMVVGRSTDKVTSALGFDTLTELGPRLKKARTLVLTASRRGNLLLSATLSPNTPPIVYHYDGDVWEILDTGA